MALIEVRPIETKRWHGKKGIENFARPVVIRALVNVSTGTYATGLTEEQERRLSTLLNIDLSKGYKYGTAHPFWDSSPQAQVKLENNTNMFNTLLPYDEIKIAILQASSLVANSMEDYENGKYPEARFVIYDKHDDDKRKINMSVQRRVLRNKVEALTRAKKDTLLNIILGESFVEQSNDYVDMKIEELLNGKDLSSVQAIIDRDDDYNFMHALVLNALYKHVLRKEGSSIYFMNERIGFDIHDAVVFLKDPNNQSYKIQIMDKTLSGVERRSSIAGKAKEEEGKAPTTIKKK